MYDLNIDSEYIDSGVNSDLDSDSDSDSDADSGDDDIDPEDINLMDVVLEDSDEKLSSFTFQSLTSNHMALEDSKEDFVVKELGMENFDLVDIDTDMTGMSVVDYDATMAGNDFSTTDDIDAPSNSRPYPSTHSKPVQPTGYEAAHIIGVSENSQYYIEHNPEEDNVVENHIGITDDHPGINNSCTSMDDNIGLENMALPSIFTIMNNLSVEDSEYGITLPPIIFHSTEPRSAKIETLSREELSREESSSQELDVFIRILRADPREPLRYGYL
ncbi:hypothetical protein F4821DRAFT_279183 [Hypoxylon rubiginosum]|uniref:Uncharacterized protein n=1 Tax=Hypoxylon rubiginosum TaxID=110542 RepID=A0ACC0CZ69_9PEZI|nr:hypothetical protein F4821DRAFT_279183 [Hypoxylon rubiginosum]